MGNFLYRGISCQQDEQNNGQLKPKGNKAEVAIRYDGKFKYDGKATHGPNVKNAVYAHQIETGLYDGCYISTTTDKEIAKKFATSSGIENGYIYVLNRDLFGQYSIFEYEVEHPENPNEKEVTIRAEDCGCIPEEVIIAKELIEIN